MHDENETDLGGACPWCSGPLAPHAMRCPACGAVLPHDESIDGLAIAGVTIVDPGLQPYATEPLHTPVLTPSTVDPIGGSIDLAGMFELAALAAPVGSAGADTSADPSTVGEPGASGSQSLQPSDREDASSPRPRPGSP